MTTDELAVTESSLNPEQASYRHVIPAGDGWLHKIEAGQTFRIVDMEGNQAADTIFYDAHDPANRYSAMDTIAAQGKAYLTTGSVLRSGRGDPLLSITADTCGRHDTVGGACAAESNQVRYSLNKKFMHNCRNTFLHQLLTTELGQNAPGGPLGKRDIGHNINFFMNVPITPEGGLTFADGISAPGRYVEMVADRDVLCLISNCPQLNNPCNAYNPTPVEVIIWDAA